MRPSHRACSLAALVLCLLCWAAPDASFACEAGTCITSTWPQEGADDVASDASMWVFYTVAGPGVLDATLLDSAGDAVPVETRTELGGTLSLAGTATLIVTPLSPLESAASYTLQIVQDAASSDLCAGPTQLAFTTGLADSTPAASYEGMIWIDGSFLDGEAMDLGSNCNHGPERWELLAQPVEAGPPGAVAWRLYAEDQIEPVATGPSDVVAFDVPEDAEETVRNYYLVAVNAADVESPVSRSEAWPPQDDSEDRGQLSDIVCSPITPCCSMSSGGRGSSGLSAGLALLGLLALGRRRRQRQP